MRILSVIGALLLITGAPSLYGADEVRIFLKAGVDRSGSITISDIAVVEGGPVSAEHIRGISVENSLFSDGYLSRSELRSLIRENYQGTVVIYGTGVRINDSAYTKTGKPASAVILITSGKMVSALYSTDTIKIEQRGRALRHGREGEIIPVRMSSGRILQGKVVDSERVLVE